MVARKKTDMEGKDLAPEQRGGGSEGKVGFLCFEWVEQQRSVPANLTGQGWGGVGQGGGKEGDDDV